MKKKSNPLNKSLGSIDIVASARSVLFLGRDPKNEYIRAVVPIKSSLAPEAKAITFELNPGTGFKWLGESKLTAREMSGISTRSKKEVSKIDEAKAYILELLEEGDVLVKEAKDILMVEGFSDITIQRAKRELGIKTYSKGFKDKEYYWERPKTDDKI